MIVAHVGLSREFVNEFKIVSAGDSVCGEALARREQVIVENADRASAFGQFAAVYGALGVVGVQPRR